MSMDSVHSIWRAFRLPFLLPESVCCHGEKQWEVYDYGAAGCRGCGVLHSCMQCGDCPTEKNSEVNHTHTR